MLSGFLDTTYNYLNFTNPTVSLEMIVWSVFIGIVLGALASLYNKRVLGAFVRALIKGGANCPDSAVTVNDIGFKKNMFVRGALRNGGSLRKVVHCANEPDVIPPEKVNPLKKFFSSSIEFREKVDMREAKFYIPDDMMYRAEIRYEKKGTDIFSFMMTVLVFLIVVYLSLKFIPEIIGLVDSFITDLVPVEDGYLSISRILNML